MDQVKWGRRIKAFRKLKGYTQEAFAKRMNVSLSIVSQIERGKRWPSDEFIQQTTETLGVSKAELRPVDKKDY
ncbi:transcriptional regulator, XRE family [Pelagirhabdus alkalitolerans]|uniref:Transcriptional regulator, XRE family n=1 Tax=Pelagirhabdus alkalitolerans TaxID=1612202 RepID=A0A1G6MFJ1_9BACI|nr:helix-turn-helix transcriptional regulator [Pelagirhabdus alkalitolerans]SDC54398.1 transcriptional regulator, XRE family [Pelagirhabdus alkalitolerans]